MGLIQRDVTITVNVYVNDEEFEQKTLPNMRERYDAPEATVDDVMGWLLAEAINEGDRALRDDEEIPACFNILDDDTFAVREVTS